MKRVKDDQYQNRMTKCDIESGSTSLTVIDTLKIMSQEMAYNATCISNCAESVTIRGLSSANPKLYCR